MISGTTLTGVSGKLDLRDIYLSRAGNLGPICERIRFCGGNPEKVFSAVSLSPTVLENPELLIPQREIFLILDHAARELNDPAFGANLGKFVSVGDLGELGQLLAEAPTLQSAIDIAKERVCDLVQTGTELELKIVDPYAHWSYRSFERASRGREQDAMLSLGMMIAIIKAFTSNDWLPSAVVVPESVGVDFKVLEDAFGTNIYRRGETFALLFEKTLLNRSIAEKPSDTSQNLTTSEAIPASHDVVSVAQRMCELQMQTGLPKIEDVAGRMGVLPRTLQRRLQERGSSFRSLYREAIMIRAEELVTNSALPIGRIAVDLGYSETSQFTRAFRSWAGVPPQEVRNQPGQIRY